MKQRFALVTGASRGLGEFLARRLWDAGYSLSLIARSTEDLERVASSLPERDGQTRTTVALDLLDLPSIDLLATQVRSRWPRLDVLVNNAAMQGPIGPLCENDFTAWQQTIAVDLLAPVSLCRSFVPWMKETGGGAIINLSGGGATGPRPNFSAYGAAKAALVRFSETLAIETRAFGIRVNCVSPGAMKTAMLGEVLEKGAGSAGEKEHAIASKVFAEGGASMDRVAELVLLLASDAGRGITGKLISALWDDWERWPGHAEELASSDVYTLRRITGRDRGLAWGDR